AEHGRPTSSHDPAERHAANGPGDLARAVSPSLVFGLSSGTFPTPLTGGIDVARSRTRRCGNDRAAGPTGHIIGALRGASAGVLRAASGRRGADVARAPGAARGGAGGRLSRA